jgi:16S rRNA (uracil1498-N3)-methyltransferase
MPATPAWPPSSLPRLFVEQRLEPDALLQLDGPPAHYLGAVLRLDAGAKVKLFDDITGEWLAEIVESRKRRVALRLVEQLRAREAAPDVWLLFAPIKRGRIDWVVEKATELGVARIGPVLTRRTIVDRINPERLRAHMIEAAEQCERTALPELAPVERLQSLLDSWPNDRMLLFADESGGTPIAEAAHRVPTAILIGPEGGFTADEARSIRAVSGAKPVSLGPRILRADTAAVAALSVWMATAGDWSRHGNR